MTNVDISPQHMAMLETFRQSYNYAPDMQSATDYLTTADVYEQLKEGAGTLSFGHDYLDNWLTEAGYATTMVEMKRYWLFSR